VSAKDFVQAEWRRQGGQTDRMATAQCTGKARYESPVTARQVQARSGKRSGKRPKVYRCEFCGGWHLGRGK